MAHGRGHCTGNDNATATRSRDHRAGGGATRRVRVTLVATHPGLPVHRRHPLESLRCAAHEHTLHGSRIPTPQCHRNAKLTRIMLNYKMRRCQSPPVWQENKLGDRKRASESLEQVAKERIVSFRTDGTPGRLFAGSLRNVVPSKPEVDASISAPVEDEVMLKSFLYVYHSGTSAMGERCYAFQSVAIDHIVYGYVGEVWDSQELEFSGMRRLQDTIP